MRTFRISSVSVWVVFLLSTCALAHGQVASLSTGSLSFGNQATGTTSSAKSVRVTNTGAVPLVISSIAPPNAPFLEVSTCPLAPAPLAPRANCTISVTFSPITTGAFSGSVSIADNAGGSPHTITLKGTGVAPVTFSSSSLNFGKVGVGSTTTKMIALHNNLNTSLTVSSTTASGSFTANGACGTVPAGGQCSISVTFGPLQLGSFTGTLTVADSASTSPQNVSLSGTGTTSGLISVAIAPASPQILVGGTQQFMATGTFPTGILLDLTGVAYWKSSLTRVASISNLKGSQGLATGKAAGTANISATVSEISGSTTLTVGGSKATATVTLSNVTQTYDGTPKSATVTTNPLGLAVIVTYNGSLTTPTNAGSYSVVATVNDTNYQGSATGTLTINKAAAMLALRNLAQVYDGAAKSATVSTTPAGLTGVSVTYNGSTTQPINAGNYAVVASLSNANYSASNASGTLVISSTVPTVNVVGGSFAFDGNPHGATATATGIGGASVGGIFSITYNGQPTIPINAGNYPVVANFTSNDPNYTNASGSGSLVITAPNVTLVSIAVTPPNASIAVGGAQQFTAIGSYSDNSTQDLTNAATWASSGSTIATVIAGLATSPANGCGGSAVVSATTASVTGSSTLTVAPSDGFACGGNLTEARDPHTSTQLETGAVLIAGGFGSGGTAVSTAELYNPVTGSSTSTGTMTSARANHTATLLPNGKVLIVGGADASGATLASAELYDTVTGTFKATGPMRSARQQHTATLLNDGTALIVGGVNGNGEVGSVELYTPATGVFTTPDLGSFGLRVARDSHTATLLNWGGVLIAGGFASGGIPTDVVEIYDPTCCLYRSSDTLRRGRALHSATALSNGRVLLAGGVVDQYGSSTDNAELYDPLADTFAFTSQSMQWQRNSHTATALTNSKVLIAGGYDSTLGAALDNAELYDPVNDTFSPTLPLKTARFNHTETVVHCAQCPEDGWVLLAGGTDGTGAPLSSTEWYTPSHLAPPGLTGIQITPSNPTIPMGTTLRLTATGDFASGPQPLEAVSWTAADPTVLSITDDGGNSGLAYPIRLGQVTANACVGAMCGSTVVTVGPPVLVSISVTPATSYILVPPGTPQQLTATGKYSDGSTSDLSLTAAWSSSNMAVATIDANGLVTPPAPTLLGTTTITALDSTGGVSGSATVTISDFVANRAAFVPPGDRGGPGMVFVPIDKAGSTNYTLLFGGFGSSNPDLGDTWIYKNGAWTLSPASSPSGRSGAGMAYDAVTKTVVLFGGNRATDGHLDLNDTWIWDGSNWTQAIAVNDPNSPPARRWDTQGMAYHAGSGKVLLFGGVLNNGTMLGDTWTWDGTQQRWTEQTPSTSPSARRAPMAYDPATGTIVLFGGEESYFGPTLNDTWTWDGTGWTQQTPGIQPPPRSLASMAFDNNPLYGSGRLVMFGGATAGSSGPYFNDTWTWDGNNWSQVSLGNTPPERYAFGMAYDPSAGILIYGGLDLNDTVILGDMWALVP